MTEICYKKNPIKESIARIDFLNSIPTLSNEIPKKITDEIKKYFPKVETRELEKISAKDLFISKKEQKEPSSTKFIESSFYNTKGTRRLVLTEDFVSLTHYDYETYEEFKKEFIIVLDLFYSVFEEIQVKRFGVRYVNSIEFPKGDPFSWNKYLNSYLLSSFKLPIDKKTISRAFHILELNHGEFNTKFQYGMPNPDYPASIKKKIFILDFDTHYSGILEKSDIEEYFPKFHSKIQELFEKSITDKYREILNND